jgi:hypothetical protein
MKNWTYKHIDILKIYPEMLQRILGAVVAVIAL